MAAQQGDYLCIDLKSFYASVECVDRGLDPFTTNLVVADPTRGEKTICLAVSPAMKRLGVPGRCRVFEIPQGIDYIMAAPRMRRYMEKSAEIYGIYLRRIAPEDIFVYSIDEAFFDISGYRALYGMSASQLAETLRAEVAEKTGITAACGLGTNLYLAKVALDICAKHSASYFAELDEQRYRTTLWNHRPITDFWRFGPGSARRLARMGIHTMGELAVAPADALFQEFGKDAEILLDHAWGIEPCTMADIKAYHPRAHSLSSSQVFYRPYSAQETLLSAKEMADQLALRLTADGLAARALSVHVGYEWADRDEGARRQSWRASRAGGTYAFRVPTASSRKLRKAAEKLLCENIDVTRAVRRLGVSASSVVPAHAQGEQMSLFSDDVHEMSCQQTLNAIRHRFGKNAVLKGMDLLPAATTQERNSLIGGHRSGDEDDGPQDVYTFG